MLDDSRRALDEGASVVDVFERESRERFSEVDTILADGVPGPDDPELSQLYRHAHTFKGLAASLDLPHVNEIARELATHLSEMQTRDDPATPEEQRWVVERFDRLREAVRDDLARVWGASQE